MSVGHWVVKSLRGAWVVGPTSLWVEVQVAPNGGEAGGVEGRRKMWCQG